MTNPTPLTKRSMHMMSGGVERCDGCTKTISPEVCTVCIKFAEIRALYHEGQLTDGEYERETTKLEVKYGK